MKITRVEAFHVDWGGGRSRSAWVRIGTDDGVWGLGEASPMAHGNASLEIVASAFTPMLLGADPLQTRVLQDRLFHQHITLGPEGAYTGALAAVDIALRDTHSHHPAEYNGPRDVQDVVFKTTVRPVKGTFVLTEAPGLGLEIDEAQLAKRTIPWASSARA
jgi:L-alanine-DL-glutamate epimerase-like enolase superfamily enzyme